VEDAKVMEQVRDGCVERLALLFERHQVHLYNFFLRLTGQRGVSEDLVQEVFGRQPKVRQRLVSALPRQTSPRVQMALVDLLGGLREQRALDALRALLGAPGTTPEVAHRVHACLAARPL